MLKRVKPPEHGVIVRTAAEGATEEELEADLAPPARQWNDIQKKAKKGQAPTVLYEEPELTVRVVRDLFTDEEFKGLVTDSHRVYDKIDGYLSRGRTRPRAEGLAARGPAAGLRGAPDRRADPQGARPKVWLPSGGYLIIERTEAMTIVDVNTGKSVGKTNLEATVVNTNLEAARGGRAATTAARHRRHHRDRLHRHAPGEEQEAGRGHDARGARDRQDALAGVRDRAARPDAGHPQAGVRGLVESFSETCPTCEGRGIILTYDVR